jgi:hypothetical protein
LGARKGIILFGGQWKVPSLVAIGMFHVWMPLEGEINKLKKKHPFHLLPLFTP